MHGLNLHHQTPQFTICITTTHATIACAQHNIQGVKDLRNMDSHNTVMQHWTETENSYCYAQLHAP